LEDSNEGGKDFALDIREIHKIEPGIRKLRRRGVMSREVNRFPNLRVWNVFCRGERQNHYAWSPGNKSV